MKKRKYGRKTERIKIYNVKERGSCEDYLLTAKGRDRLDMRQKKRENMCM